MKKLVLFSAILVLLFSWAFPSIAETENVVQMTYVVKLPDVTREGKYTGELLNGVPHGYGIFEATNPSSITWHYIGQWENGNMTGEGGQYWDSGESRVGLYESNDFVCGEQHTNTSSNIWFDNRQNEHGCLNYIEYRTDGTVMFDGCISQETGRYHQGTLYSADGKIIHSGDLSSYEPALEHSINLTAVTYEQLVSIKDQITLAIWNSKEWQEVEVPQGVWLVGEDIPAGHWTITCAGGSYTWIKLGTALDESGRRIDPWKSSFYYGESVYNPNNSHFDRITDMTSIDLQLKNGTYVIIEYANAIFTPYSGKPSFGFK